MKKVLFMIAMCLLVFCTQAQILEDDGRETKVDSLIKIGKLPIVNTTQYLLTGDEGRVKKIPVLDSIPYPIIITGSTDTTGRLATKPGDIYINTTLKHIYISTGSGRGKFSLLNLFLPMLLIRRRRIWLKRPF